MGKKTSLRGDFKGVNQVAGWVGKGKDTSGYKATDHQSTPLSALKDPDSFGPPPVRRAAGDVLPPPSRSAHSAGLGAPVATGTINGQESRLERERREAQEAEEEAERKAQAPPLPYRVDTTGLSTAGLPPPPKRGDVASPASPGAGKTKPSLPPRLPPRGVAAEPISPPPAYAEQPSANPGQGILNQGALNRLGQAGVKVPGLSIGTEETISRPPSLPSRAQISQFAPPQEPASPLGHGRQMSELQQRFAKMSSGRQDGAAAEISSPAGHAPSSPLGKKAPPPPPPKKKELHSSPTGDSEAPPPIPMSSKPGFR